MGSKQKLLKLPVICSLILGAFISIESFAVKSLEMIEQEFAFAPQCFCQDNPNVKCPTPPSGGASRTLTTTACSTTTTGACKADTGCRKQCQVNTGSNHWDNTGYCTKSSDPNHNGGSECGTGYDYSSSGEFPGRCQTQSIP